MAWYSTKAATTVYDDDAGFMVCVYHQTPVVKWNARKVILNSGGYQGVTTKRRMNEVAEHYGLNYQVYQKDYKWYVDIPGMTLDFTDGMVFDA